MERKPRLCVWLSSLPDAKQGLSLKADPEAPLRYTKRATVVLNAAAADLQEMSELKRQGAWSDDDLAAGAVVAWAIVEPQFICNHLQPLTSGQKIQRKFWHSVGPGDEHSVFFFKIVEIHVLARPVKIDEWACLQNHAFFSLLTDVAFGALEAAWQEQSPAFCEQQVPVDVVRLPLCFAVMCSKKAWDSFAVCDMSLKAGGRKKTHGQGQGGWHLGLTPHLRQAFPDVPWIADPEEIAKFSIQDPDNAEEFLDEIKNVVMGLQQGEHVDLERLYFFLTAFAGYMNELRGMLDFHRHGKRSKNQAFGLTYLIKCFLLSQSLRSASQLKTALHSAAGIILPKQASQIMQAALDTNSNSVPSAAAISKARGRIDVSWMLVWRDRFKEMFDGAGAVIYLGTDSSPQGGRDYQIVVLDIVKKQDLAELHTAVMRLECSAQ